MRQLSGIFYLICVLTIPSELASARPADEAVVARLQVQIQRQEELMRQMRGEIDQLRHQTIELQKKINQQANLSVVNTSTSDSPQPKVQARHQETFSQSNPPRQMTLPVNNNTPDYNNVPAPQLGLSNSNDGLKADANNSPFVLHEKSAKSSAETDYTEAMDLLNQRRFSEAEVALEQYVKKYPNDPKTVNATYWLAESYYNRSNFEQAALKFGDAYEAYLRYKNTAHATQSNAKAPEIMLKLAMSLSNIGKEEDAKVILNEMEKEFPSIPGNLKQQIALLRREIARKTT